MLAPHAGFAGRAMPPDASLGAAALLVLAVRPGGAVSAACFPSMCALPPSARGARLPVFICDNCVDIYEVREAAPPRKPAAGAGAGDGVCTGPKSYGLRIFTSLVGVFLLALKLKMT